VTPVAQRMTANLILHNGKVWTGDPRKPLAQAVAVCGERISAVGDDETVLRHAGPSTRVIDLDGRLVTPGFNDAHTHLENAIDWSYQVRLIDVDDQERMTSRLRERVTTVPPGVWITGGDWGDFASTSGEAAPFEPDLAEIDAITPDNPVLLRCVNHNYFANSKALALAHLGPDTPDPRGGRYGRDDAGRLTGMLYGQAGEFVARMVTPVSLAQRVLGAHHVLARLNAVGITSVHDISRLPALSDECVSPVFLERSFSDVRIFAVLKQRGELTVRVYAFLPLDNFDGLAGHGITPGSGDELLRFGALKVFMDSGAMLPPTPPPVPPPNGLPGGYSYRFAGHDALARRIVDGDRSGFDIGVHVIGDEAVRALVDCFECVDEVNPPRDRRHRLIHAWHVAEDDFARAGRLGLVADVTADHLLRNRKTLDGVLGAERAGNSFAWRKMIDNGILLNIVSDLPGSFNKSHLAEFNPLVNMYVAVTRRQPGGAEPFHPEQAITVEEALRAYTVNPAYASREEHVKGTVTVGKLADLVVLSNDILAGDQESLLTTEVAMTILGGTPVYEAEPARLARGALVGEGAV
jgi:predicted amidohydrolase YtcJ